MSSPACKILLRNLYEKRETHLDDLKKRSKIKVERARERVVPSLTRVCVMRDSPEHKLKLLRLEPRVLQEESRIKEKGERIYQVYSEVIKINEPLLKTSELESNSQKFFDIYMAKLLNIFNIHLNCVAMFLLMEEHRHSLGFLYEAINFNDRFKEKNPRIFFHNLATIICIAKDYFLMPKIENKSIVFTLYKRLKNRTGSHFKCYVATRIHTARLHIFFNEFDKVEELIASLLRLRNKIPEQQGTDLVQVILAFLKVVPKEHRKNLELMISTCLEKSSLE